jgi:hypothetical protein
MKQVQETATHFRGQARVSRKHPQAAQTTPAVLGKQASKSAGPLFERPSHAAARASGQHRLPCYSRRLFAPTRSSIANKRNRTLSSRIWCRPTDARRATAISKVLSKLSGPSRPTSEAPRDGLAKPLSTPLHRSPGMGTPDLNQKPMLGQELASYFSLSLLLAYGQLTGSAQV